MNPPIGTGGDRKRPTFACVYPDASNVHLVKDIGMVGNVLAREHGFRSLFVCLDRGRDYPYLADQARWLEMVKLQDDPAYRQFRWPPKSVISFLWKTSREIDVLQLFNHTRETMLLGSIYKWRNPGGFLHLKLDANEPWIAGEIARRNSSRWIAFAEYLQPHLWIRRRPDLVTAETSTSLALFQELYPWVGDRLKLLPNGVDDFWLDREGFMEISREDKENVLLVVGRIGTVQKNTELLLDALSGLEFGNWKAILAGPIAEPFRPKIEAFFRARPDLRERVLFLGEVRDRKELYGWYRKAKVFCMTSRFEGFSLALVDAIHFGCHVVSTPVSSIDDVLARGRFGKVVHSAPELERELGGLFRGESDPLREFEATRKHSESYRWSSICRNLAEWIGRRN